MKILADENIPFLKGVAEQFGEVEYLPGNLFTKKEIRDRDALIVRTITHFGKEILEGSNVKLICSATIGYDHIDTKYCDENNIAWRTAPGCNANSVEQYITASLLFLAKKHKFNLKDKTIGIVGVGNVGSRVESACRKLGMKVLLNDPPREEREGNDGATQFSDIDTIKRKADIITFHTPLTRSGKHSTWHMADEQFFKTVARKPYIINAARGGVINNRSLITAIKKGYVAAVVIDCWENEPNIDRELLAMADIATPHIAGYSADGKWNATKMSIDNLNSFFNLGIRPTFLPLPEPNRPVINLKEIPEEDQLSNAVWHSYNPMVETESLKASAEKFYLFRSNYPIRREYPAYKLLNTAAGTLKLLQELGFS